MKTAAQLRQHAHDIAQAFGVVVVEIHGLPPEDARACASARRIEVSPIVEETTYAAALHELGHILAPTGSLEAAKRDATLVGRVRLTLDEENAAWEWARKNALDWSPAMEAVAQWALSTYQESSAQVEKLVFEVEKVLDELAMQPLVSGSSHATVVEPVETFGGRIHWPRGKR